MEVQKDIEQLIEIVDNKNDNNNIEELNKAKNNDQLNENINKNLYNIQEQYENKNNNNNNNNINNDDLIINNNKNEKIIYINKDDNININEDKEKKEIEESKLDMIIKSLKEKDEIIKSLQNDINNLKKENEYFSSQIKEIKNLHEQEKQNYEKQINELKEVMAKKEDIKYFAKKRELDYIKDNLDALSDKYNNFERVIESKMGFMESNMSKIFKQEEELKELEKNVIINEKRDNIPQLSKMNFNMVVYEELNEILDSIFSRNNLVNGTIDEKNLERLLNICTNLFRNRHLPIEYFNAYFNSLMKTIGENASKEIKYNLQMKKSIIYQNLNRLNNEITPNMNSNQKKGGKINLKNFNIKKFREEFNLSEKDFPDEKLNNLYIANNGNFERMFSKLIE